jgi:hypothetical protein
MSTSRRSSYPIHVRQADRTSQIAVQQKRFHFDPPVTRVRPVMPVGATRRRDDSSYISRGPLFRHDSLC